MCGIAGILGSQRPDDARRAEAMAKSIQHRGPDAIRVGSYNDSVLGHTRLSILDLSDHGLQPLEDSQGRYVMVYNGEIYNHTELRRELSADYPFQGHCDTEVLLAAYVKWGERCLERLVGMFSLCIFDKKTQSAFFARDRFGQKPLYFHFEEDRLIFASEVKAILASGVKAIADMDTWSRYLTTAKYDDCSATYFSGISQLAPGECATWSRGKGLERRQYYAIGERVKSRHVSLATAKEETRELLIDAARLHMRADVPVAVALSGGLDSSALLACIDEAEELSEKVGCFSFEFDSDLTEREWIEAAAGYHGLKSSISSFSPENFLDSLGPTMWNLEGPIGGLATCALNNVFGPARAAGYKVIQDGTGLDEAYGGYRNHHNLYLGQLLRSNTSNVEKSLEEYALNWGVTRDEARSAAFGELKRNGGTAIDGTIPVRLDLLAEETLARSRSDISNPYPEMDLVQAALVDYLGVNKIPRNMRMKDRLSMAYGLELRLPFLDHRLIEHALSLPVEHLFFQGRSKSIIREALQGVMNEDVRVATKRSIQAPQGKWLISEPMCSYIDDLINSESFAQRGLFDVKAAKDAFHHFRKGTTQNSFFVWQWINVEEWFRTFVDTSPLAAQKPAWNSGNSISPAA
jgi:asparagine synthase (glutamine-hydrolysing)